ncbi:OmpA family protein [compost metagenome]
MTLKRYQPARKRKRPSKKNRPLKLAVAAVGVVGIAAGAAYLGLHGEILVALFDGSVDLPSLPSKAPSGSIAAMPDDKKPAPAPVVAKASPTPKLSLAASPEALKLTAKASPSPDAAPPAFALGKASPKPSAFPEDGKAPQAAAAPDDLLASAVPLKPAGVIPAEELPKPKVATSVASPKPVAIAAITPKPSPKATPTPKPAPVAKASELPKAKPVPVAKASVAPKPAPTAKPKAAPVAAARPQGGQRASLYFDKNSSYLSGAERGRLERLAGSLKGGTIHVSGYADAQGDAKYNRWMAERRAQRVAEIIRAQTGGKVQVVVDGIGTLAGDGESKNRRVEVEVR